MHDRVPVSTGRNEGFELQNVSCDGLDRTVVAVSSRVGVSGENGDSVSSPKESVDDVSSDKARTAGDEYLH